MNNKILGTLNISKKAGKLLMGADVCFTALEDNKARLVLISNDCSRNSVKRIIQMAEENGTPLVTLDFDKETLGKSLGKATVAIMAVTDTGLASSIGKNIAQLNPDKQAVSDTLDLKLKRQKERVQRKNDENAKPRPKKTKTQAMYVDDDKIDEKVLEQKLIRREDFHKKLAEKEQKAVETPIVKQKPLQENKPKQPKQEIKLEKLEIKPQTEYNSNINTAQNTQTSVTTDENSSLKYNDQPKKSSIFGKLFGKHK